MSADEPVSIPVARPFRFQLVLAAGDVGEVDAEVRQRLEAVAGVVSLDEDGGLVRLSFARENVALKPAILEAIAEVARAAAVEIVDVEYPEGPAVASLEWSRAIEVSDEVREKRRCAVCGQSLFFFAVPEHTDHWLHPPGECLEALGLEARYLRKRVDALDRRHTHPIAATRGQIYREWARALTEHPQFRLGQALEVAIMDLGGDRLVAEAETAGVRPWNDDQRLAVFLVWLDERMSAAE